VIFCLHLFSTTAVAQGCPSQAKLKITSSGYSGTFDVELRRGKRPGSLIIQSRSIQGNGTIVFKSVCRGTYFFSFGTTDSDQVSITRYFEVINDGDGYSSPTITVFYSRGTHEGIKRVGSSKKRDL